MRNNSDVPIGASGKKIILVLILCVMCLASCGQHKPSHSANQQYDLIIDFSCWNNTVGIQKPLHKEGDCLKNFTYEEFCEILPSLNIKHNSALVTIPKPAAQSDKMEKEIDKMQNMLIDQGFEHITFMGRGNAIFNSLLIRDYFKCSGKCK